METVLWKSRKLKEEQVGHMLQKINVTKEAEVSEEDLPELGACHNPISFGK
jgi:hypothetical protein